MRRVLALLAVVALFAVACDGADVNRWRIENGLPPLDPATAAEVARVFTAIEVELQRRATFVGEVHGVSAARLGSSWRPGCPVGPSQLRLLRLSYHGFDGQTHIGELVVHHALAGGVVAVFRTLFEEKFPIRVMRTVEQYGSSDDASMAADNTSGFNCRTVKGSSSWSRHAFGQAIDVNPIENPYVIGWVVDPPAGYAHTNRSTPALGKIRSGDVAQRAFADHGWSWGGYWNNPDYQHFSA